METVREAARRAGVSRLIGIHRPTPRNALVSDLFAHLGFVAEPPLEGSSERRFTCDLRADPVGLVHRIKNSAPELVV
jgi:predicted enzyme involved in methoxymalonyl-ACP biosynthesis